MWLCFDNYVRICGLNCAVAVGICSRFVYDANVNMRLVRVHSDFSLRTVNSIWCCEVYVLHTHGIFLEKEDHFAMSVKMENNTLN
jgi:hypothetical protein